MIENDIIKYLAADSTLDTLLSSSASDSKIYPNFPKKEAAEPFILYKLGFSGQTDEHFYICEMMINVVGTTKAQVDAIRNRIEVLINKQDEIQDTLYNYSTDYYIYYSKLVGMDQVYEPERNNFQSMMTFEIIYQKK